MRLVHRVQLTRWRVVVAAFGLMVVGLAWPLVSRWRERQFVSSLTPQQHYVRAVLLCRGNQQGPRRCSAGDLKAAIHHLEAIPKDSNFYEYEDAADMLQLLEIQRDRPQDFDAAERAKFQECKAEVKAEIEKFDAWEKAQEEIEAPMRPCPGLIDRDGRCRITRCASGLYRRNCAPFATAQRYAELEVSLNTHR